MLTPQAGRRGKGPQTERQLRQRHHGVPGTRCGPGRAGEVARCALGRTVFAPTGSALTRGNRSQGRCLCWTQVLRGHHGWPHEASGRGTVPLSLGFLAEWKQGIFTKKQINGKLVHFWRGGGGCQSASNRFPPAFPRGVQPSRNNSCSSCPSRTKPSAGESVTSNHASGRSAL